MITCFDMHCLKETNGRGDSFTYLHGCMSSFTSLKDEHDKYGVNVSQYFSAKSLVLLTTIIIPVFLGRYLPWVYFTRSSNFQASFWRTIDRTGTFSTTLSYFCNLDFLNIFICPLHFRGLNSYSTFYVTAEFCESFKSIAKRKLLQTYFLYFR